MPWGLTRFHHSGQSHFVTFCCYHRGRLLTTDASCRIFESALERVQRSYGLHVYGCVVMPEHVHLLLSERQQDTLADAQKSLKQGVARRLLGNAEHFWQKRYYDFNIRDYPQFVEKLRYIQRNRSSADYASARRTGNGAASGITLPAAREGLRLSRSGQQENANEWREHFVQPSNCPTQAKIGLEWATRPGAPCSRNDYWPT
jgi:putative transposase